MGQRCPPSAAAMGQSLCSEDTRPANATTGPQVPDIDPGMPAALVPKVAEAGVSREGEPDMRTGAESSARPADPVADEAARAAAAAESKRVEDDKVAAETQRIADDTAAELAKRAEDEAHAAEAQRIQEEVKAKRLEDYKVLIADKEGVMKTEVKAPGAPANRYGFKAKFPPFDRAKHIPIVALINPSSGAQAGGDILNVARRHEYYQDRFFNIIDVVRGQGRGGLMDVLRLRLQEAKEEAKAMNVRMRVISGGGDGTASFALFILLKTLRANPAREEEEGLGDTGNGFIWTDAEMEESFPAMAQLPLGSANDFGNILGWGQKYPGDRAPPKCCFPRSWIGSQLCSWIAAAIDPNTQICNFDMWGLMPAAGAESCDFKIAELTGPRGRSPCQKIDGTKQLIMKEADKPVPFFIGLYFSTGFGAYMVARFQINRRATPFQNRMEYVRQGAGIVLESTPPQLRPRAAGITIVDEYDKQYFPPRDMTPDKGKRYRDVGFYNINWQAHIMHGADRASCAKRCCGSRTGAVFNDGLLDLYRMRFTTYIKNPGTVMQTDKRKDITLSYEAAEGKGIFFQYDGEARYAFSTTGAKFSMHVRKVLNIPVVMGPFYSKKLVGDALSVQPVKFSISGDDDEMKNRVRRRIAKLLDGTIEDELLATTEDMKNAKLNVAPPPGERS